MRGITTLAASALFAAFTVTSASADAQVMINISQSGGDVLLTANGTFDTSLATVINTQPLFSPNIVPNDGFIALGTQGSVTAYRLTGPTNFGAGTSQTSLTTTSGTAIGIYAGYPDFFISTGYVSNSAISSIGTVSGATLASLGLSTGIYAFAVGGNTVTVDIGHAAPAVPEPAAWALMVLGFGGIGGTMRRYGKAGTALRFT